MAFNVISNITLDMKHAYSVSNIVQVNQYDTAGVIKAQLLNDGAKWSVPQSAKPVVMFKKTDNIGGFYDVTDTDPETAAVSIDTDRSIIYISLDPQTTTTATSNGKYVDMQVAFFENGLRISTFAFYMQVLPSVITSGDLLPDKNKQFTSSWIFNILSKEIADTLTVATTPDAMREWLEDKIGASIESGAYAIDDSLTVPRFAADAEATGKMVVVSDQNPNRTANKVWVKKTPATLEIPTMEDVDELKSALNIVDDFALEGSHTISTDDLEIGKWNYSIKAVNPHLLRSKAMIKVKAGMRIAYTNPTYQILFGILSTPTANSYVQGGFFIDAPGEGVWDVLYDGYLVLMIKSANDISLSDYDCSIVFKTLIKDEITAIQGTLDGAILTDSILTTSGKYIDQYGREANVSNFAISGFYAISDSMIFTLKSPVTANNGNTIAFYREAHEDSYICGESTSEQATDKVFATPRYAKYVRFSYRSNKKFLISYKVNDTFINETAHVETEIIPKPCITKKDFTEAGYIKTNGDISSTAKYTHTALYRIPSYAKTVDIIRSTKMVASCIVAFYTDNAIQKETFISGYSSATDIDAEHSVSVPIPANAKYVAFTSRDNSTPQYDRSYMVFSNLRLYEDRKLSGLATFSVIGDSYTAYPGWVPDGQECYYPSGSATVDDVSQMWWHILANKAKIQPLIIDGWSGSTICTHVRSGHTAADAFVNRIKNSMGERRTLDTKPNYIFILGGQNDTSVEAEVGSVMYSGWTDDDLYKFAPAFCFLLDYLIRYNPGAVIINISNTDGVGSDYLSAMAEACTHYNVPNIISAGLSRTSGHPTATGMQQLASIVCGNLP